MRKKTEAIIRQYFEEFKSETIEENVIHNDGFLQIVRTKHRFPGGRIIPREKILKNGRDGSAVIMLALTKNLFFWRRKVILVVEPRVYTKRKIGLGLPAGYIEEGETPTEAAVRELREETGYIGTPVKEIASFYQDEGCSSAYNHIVFIKDCVKKEIQQLDPDEQVKYLECTYKEALELVKRGLIEGANSILGLEKGKRLIRR